MSRCDYDTIFQRVSCVTLVAVAITFTVILTNVFVDIDGLLARKDTVKNYDIPEPVFENEHNYVKIKPSPNQIRPEYYKEERNYEEDREDTYRSKRSLETPNFLFHMKNPKMKSILTDRLATLLEELDEEESTTNSNEKQAPDSMMPKMKIKVISPEGIKKIHSIEEVKEDHPKKEVKMTATNKVETANEEDMLHLAMHNILLQGIIGHLDLNDVFKKVHLLMNNFKEPFETSSAKEFLTQTTKRPEPSTLSKEIKQLLKTQHNPADEEDRFFEELSKCEKLQNDITNSGKVKSVGKAASNAKGPKLLIKTVIDITSNKDKTHRDVASNSQENVRGLIKLIYNGKPIKFNRMEDEDKPAAKRTTVKPTKTKSLQENISNNVHDVEINERVEEPKPERLLTKKIYFNKIIETYLKNHPSNLGNLINNSEDEKNLGKEGKRLKRQIKLRYDDDEKSPPQAFKPKGEDDDELYVEIETHFDSKGMKGMKKKKLIRNIIDKIEKAIHSDLEQQDKEKKIKQEQIKKRNQNPLDRNKDMLNKIILPFDAVVKKQYNPITKTVQLDNLAGKSGDTWKKAYYGPKFLAYAKSMNSAEMGELDVDYNKVMEVNGIPQRLQKPLNTDLSEETADTKPFFGLGNLKFFVKNIDGTGLSIGFNQYTDEPPDPEAIKLFTGIENLVHTFNKNYDDENTLQPQKQMTSSAETEHELTKRDVRSDRKTNEHIVIRRSMKEVHDKDYQSNEYKLVFNNNYLPYNSYNEIFEGKKKRVAITTNGESETNELDNLVAKEKVAVKKIPTLMKGNIFFKKLKPAEILTLATLLDRKKRSIIIQKYTSLKSKGKMNRYINTRAMNKKKIILNNKRNKRQIGKIRIIATDDIPTHAQSDENIFLVNGEKVLADRAIIRQVDDRPSMINRIAQEKNSAEHYELLPYIYEESPYVTNIFDGRSRRNHLMSKYPHILMEEMGRSKEEMEPVLINHFDVKPKIIENESIENVNDNKTEYIDQPIAKIDELVKAIEPKQNYKLTLKIFPRNISDLDSGFKEVHTSINKSFNKDGLIYSSIVNVSEISRIENQQGNTEITTRKATTPSIFTESSYIKHFKDQPNKIDVLLKQHKTGIDSQLDHLKKERNHLDTMYTTHEVPLKSMNLKKTHQMNTPVVTETSKTTIENPLLNISKDDVSKLLALLRKQSQNKLITDLPKANPTETIEPVKLKLLNTIQKNENTTNEILQQINKNTVLLQTFLQKLTDKLKEEKETKVKSEEIKPKKSESWQPLNSLQNHLFQPQKIETKNETRYTIPFIYAYQQTLPLNNNFKPDVPVARVIYTGHIHPNAFNYHTPEMKTTLQPKSRNVVEDERNQTRYFIDDMEHFKVLPVQKPKPVIVLPLKNNTATVGNQI